MNPFGEFNNPHDALSPQRLSIAGLLLWVIDIAAIGIAFQLAYSLAGGGGRDFFLKVPGSLKFFVVMLPLWILILILLRISRIPTRNYKALLLLYLQSSIIVFFLLALVSFALSPGSINFGYIIFLSLSGSLMLYTLRILDYKIFTYTGKRGNIHKNIVLIADDTSLTITDLFHCNKRLGFHIAVIFTESELIRKRYERSTFILPEKYLGILNDLIEVDMIDEVIYLKNKAVPGEIRAIVRSCEELGVTFRMKHDDPGSTLSTAKITDIASGKFLSFINVPYNSLTLSIRKTMDVNLGIILITALLPLLVLIAVLIKISSRGPVLNRQPVIGSQGRPFDMFRFRTMFVRSHKDHKTGNEIMKDSSFRQDFSPEYHFTWIGKFLRRSSLDKLPQLLNVVRGEMSVTGRLDSSHN